MSFGNEVQLKVYQNIEENIIPVSFEELEAKAKQKLEAKPFDYVAASAGAEITARNNNTRDMGTEGHGDRFLVPIIRTDCGAIMTAPKTQKKEFMDCEIRNPQSIAG